MSPLKTMKSDLQSDEGLTARHVTRQSSTALLSLDEHMVVMRGREKRV